MNKGRIIVISGPSGSGKTTLSKRLLSRPKFKGKLVRSISATTRLKRPGEKNNRDYIFISPKRFESKIKAGHFLEWQKVFDNYYGTLKKNVEELLKRGKNVLLCIDVKGAKVVFGKFPRAAGIFIKTPAISVLKRRLLARGESFLSLKLRLKTAHQELKESAKYDYIIINDDLKKASKNLENIIAEVIKPGVLAE